MTCCWEGGCCCCCWEEEEVLKPSWWGMKTEELLFRVFTLCCCFIKLAFFCIISWIDRSILLIIKLFTLQSVLRHIHLITLLLLVVEHLVLHLVYLLHLRVHLVVVHLMILLLILLLNFITISQHCINRILNCIKNYIFKYY